MESRVSDLLIVAWMLFAVLVVELRLWYLVTDEKFRKRCEQRKLGRR